MSIFFDYLQELGFGAELLNDLFISKNSAKELETVLHMALIKYDEESFITFFKNFAKLFKKDEDILPFLKSIKKYECWKSKYEQQRRFMKEEIEKHELKNNAK